LTPSFEVNPSTQRKEILSRNTRVLGAAHSENFVILACTVFIQCQGVTDGWTDGHTPRRWLRRAKHSTIARKNSSKNHYVEIKLFAFFCKNGRLPINGIRFALKINLLPSLLKLITVLFCANL